jgi:hypothetical protein
MFAQLLFITGVLPLILLGGMHLAFTLRDHKAPRFIVPRSNSLIHLMQAEPLRLSAETDMWRAWIGFNISHSIAVMGLGVAYLYLAVVHFDLLRGDIIILWTAPALAWVFVILSKCFWFSKPFQGSLVAAVLLTAGALLAPL